MTDTDPIALFDEWFAQACDKEPNDPTAMALATVDPDGRPSARMVLLKAHGADGFVFYTNLESRKGLALGAHPHAALLFHWKSLRRQIRIEGPVTPVSDAEADAYFASRDHLSRVGAHASRQSREMNGAGELVKRVGEVEARYIGREIPRPAHWTGLRVYPERMEFWTDKPYRLHERRLFERKGDDWRESRLFP